MKFPSNVCWRAAPQRCYDDAMPEEGRLDLGDRIVWYKNGNIHREDGPAIGFKDGRKLWALNGQEATEQESAAHRQARERSGGGWRRRRFVISATC
ncbi:MAG: hypothetical protein ABSE93_10970 [Terriglobia bacterium]